MSLKPSGRCVLGDEPVSAGVRAAQAMVRQVDALAAAEVDLFRHTIAALERIEHECDEALARSPEHGEIISRLARERMDAVIAAARRLRPTTHPGSLQHRVEQTGDHEDGQHGAGSLRR